MRRTLRDTLEAGLHTGAAPAPVARGGPSLTSLTGRCRTGQRWWATPEAKDVSQTGREYAWARAGP